MKDGSMEITLMSAASITGMSPTFLAIEVIQKRLKARTRNRHWRQWMISFENLMKWRDDARERGLNVD